MTQDVSTEKGEKTKLSEREPYFGILNRDCRKTGFIIEDTWLPIEKVKYKYHPK